MTSPILPGLPVRTLRAKTPTRPLHLPCWVLRRRSFFEFPPRDFSTSGATLASKPSCCTCFSSDVRHCSRSRPLPLSYTWSSWQSAVGLAAGDKDNVLSMLAAAKMKWPLAGCHVRPSRINSLDQMQHYLIRRSAGSVDVFVLLKTVRALILAQRCSSSNPSFGNRSVGHDNEERLALPVARRIRPAGRAAGHDYSIHFTALFQWPMP